MRSVTFVTQTWKIVLATALLLLLVPVVFAGPAVINEIRIDQPGSDVDEYFELSGPAGESLDGLTYLVIGDGTGGSGVIEAVVDLSGATIPAGGFFVAAEASFTLGTADLTTSLGFENSDNVPPGRVIGQDPPAGTERTFGLAVDLVVSSGPASGLVFVPVPNLAGNCQTEAETLLEQSGLSIDELVVTTDNGTPGGEVINQEPVFATSVPQGTGVSITVSSGSQLHCDSEKIINTIARLLIDTEAVVDSSESEKLIKALNKAMSSIEKGQKKFDKGEFGKSKKEFNKAIKKIKDYEKQVKKLGKKDLPPTVVLPLRLYATDNMSDLKALITTYFPKNK